MKQIDFLYTLYKSMDGLPEKMRRDILENYKTHYHESIEKGEPEEQISERLGDPVYIAECVRKDSHTDNELVKQRLNIRASYGDSILPKVEKSVTATCRQGGLSVPDKHDSPVASGNSVCIQQSTVKNDFEWHAKQEQPDTTNRNNRFHQTDYGTGYGYEQFDYRRSRGNSALKKLTMTALLFFTNLVFVLGPWLAIVGVLVGFWGAAIGMSIGGVAGAALCLLSSTIPALGVFTGGLTITTTVAGCVAISSLGILLTLMVIILSKWFIRLTGLYAGWTIQMITGRRTT